jgi:hypothetical protein
MGGAGDVLHKTQERGAVRGGGGVKMQRARGSCNLTKQAEPIPTQARPISQQGQVGKAGQGGGGGRARLLNVATRPIQAKHTATQARPCLENQRTKFAPDSLLLSSFLPNGANRAALGALMRTLTCTQQTCTATSCLVMLQLAAVTTQISETARHTG